MDLKKFFIVIQLQLYAFSPHPTTPPQPNIINRRKKQTLYGFESTANHYITHSTPFPKVIWAFSRCLRIYLQ